MAPASGDEPDDHFETIRLSLHERNTVAALLLNRPAARNAISRLMADELFAACGWLNDQNDLRAVVISGGGEQAFCAGADLKERRSLSAMDKRAHTRAIAAAADAIAVLPVPVIAAIRGFALAGGGEIALACDLRVAATDASFGFPEVKIGIFPGAGGVERLLPLIGPGAARDLLFTGRTIDAAEALRFGLVDRLVQSEAVFDEAMVLALEISANAPLAVRAVKQAFQAAATLPPASGRAALESLRVPLDASEDYQEGLNAFAERRTPRFHGR